MEPERANTDILAVAEIVAGLVLAGAGLWSLVARDRVAQAFPLLDAASLVLGLWVLIVGIRTWRRRPR